MTGFGEENVCREKFGFYRNVYYYFFLCMKAQYAADKPTCSLISIDRTCICVNICVFLFERFSFIRFVFQFKTFNPIFTQVEIWFRFAFLILTFIVTVSS